MITPTIALFFAGFFLHAQGSTAESPPAKVCSTHLGTVSLEFTAAFLNLEDFNDDSGLALYVTSFFNVALDPRTHRFVSADVLVLLDMPSQNGLAQ